MPPPIRRFGQRARDPHRAEPNRVHVRMGTLFVRRGQVPSAKHQVRDRRRKRDRPHHVSTSARVSTSDLEGNPRRATTHGPEERRRRHHHSPRLRQFAPECARVRWSRCSAREPGSLPGMNAIPHTDERAGWSDRGQHLVPSTQHLAPSTSASPINGLASWVALHCALQASGLDTWTRRRNAPRPIFT